MMQDGYRSHILLKLPLTGIELVLHITVGVQNIMYPRGYIFFTNFFFENCGFWSQFLPRDAKFGHVITTVNNPEVQSLFLILLKDIFL